MYPKIQTFRRVINLLTYLKGLVHKETQVCQWEQVDQAIKTRIPPSNHQETNMGEHKGMGAQWEASHNNLSLLLGQASLHF